MTEERLPKRHVFPCPSHPHSPLARMEDSLPIIEVTEDNFTQVWPSIVKAVKDATFVALDCELSGLGTKHKINSPELDVRYQNLVDLAHSHAVVALGVSCFLCSSVSSISIQDDRGEQRIRSHDYTVQTFNILTLCTDPFTVECSSLKFLLDHGFDFNKLYSKGIQYYKGCDRQDNEAPGVRHIFSKILEYGKPIIIHNGLLDMAFLYQSFYSDLPKKNDTFAADLDDLFPFGVYDTKYIAEFHQSMPASYLEYLFKKMQLKNASRQKKGEWHVRLRFPPYPKHAPSIDWHPYLQIHSYSPESDDDARELCQNFASFGFCKQRTTCPLSHNVNRAVNVLQRLGAKKRGKPKYVGPMNNKNGSVVHIIEKFCQAKADHSKLQQNEMEVNSSEKKRVRSRKRRRLSEEEDDNSTRKSSSSSQQSEISVVEEQVTEDQDFVDSEPVKAENGGNVHMSGHRAGFDAFMTGYVFANTVAEKGVWTSKDDSFTPENAGLVDQVNRIYLMGKNIPFLIRTGTYANKSVKHCKKIMKVRSGQEPLRNV